MLTRVETLVLRVSDYATATDWYCDLLGCKMVFSDAEKGLAVIRFRYGTSLTLWQLPPGERPATAACTCPFPIIQATDAVRQRAFMARQGVRVSTMSEVPGLRSFSFWDPDGNRLEICELRVDTRAPRSTGNVLGGPWPRPRARDANRKDSEA